VNTEGKRLQQARLKRKLSVEDAARATKLRPERILDLENDTYANFPNLAYAKSFLVIYAKYLGVDVSDFIETFDVGSPVGRNDYQYLANAPQARPALRRREKSATKPMLILAAIAGAVMTFAIFVMYLVVSAQRLGFLEQPGAKKQPQAANLFAPTPAPAPSTAAVEIATPIPMNTPLVPRATSALALAAPILPQAAGASRPQPSPGSTGTPAPSPTPPPRKENEIILQPLKKAWVTVRRGGADSPPVFEDWLYPDAKGLILHGDKFWISVGEKGAVEIKKNGVVINYDTFVSIE